MKLFRERLLARLIERHAISEELARKLLAWRHPGFSAHIGKAIPFEDKKAIEDVACYVVRSPLSLKKLVYLDGQKAVLYRSRMNPSLGRNFEAMDPLEWLARLADHIPDPGKHRTHFYAHYANRVRGERPPEELTSHGGRPGAAQEAPLLAQLGAAHLQGLSRGSARVQTRRRPPRPSDIYEGRKWSVASWKNRSADRRGLRGSAVRRPGARRRGAPALRQGSRLRITSPAFKGPIRGTLASLSDDSLTLVTKSGAAPLLIERGRITRLDISAAGRAAAKPRSAPRSASVSA